MAIQDIMIQDLMSIERDTGNLTFNWMGADYVCIPATATEDSTLGDGGFSRAADIILKVHVNLFPTAIYPMPQQTLIYNTRSYRIDKVSFDVFRVMIKLTCTETDKGV